MDGLAGPRVYNGIADCVVQVYRNEGINGFFRGMPTTLIRSFPVNAVTFSVVTWFLRAFESPAEAGSVTYQDIASFQVQESLATTATFGQDRQVFCRPVHNEWLGEWKSPAVLMMTGINPMASAPIYAVQYHGPVLNSDWFSGLTGSFTHSSPATHTSDGRSVSATDATAGLLAVSDRQEKLKDDSACQSISLTASEVVRCATHHQTANLIN